MQILLASVAVLLVAKNVVGIPDEMKEMAALLRSTCIAESGATAEAVDKASKGDFEADNKNLQCYMKCLFIQMSAMTEDGTFEAETILATLPPEMQSDLRPVMDICSKEDDSDICMKAMKINQCMFKQNPSAYTLV